MIANWHSGLEDSSAHSKAALSPWAPNSRSTRELITLFQNDGKWGTAFTSRDACYSAPFVQSESAVNEQKLTQCLDFSRSKIYWRPAAITSSRRGNSDTPGEHPFTMPLFKNYYVRWFLFSFATGVLLPPVLFLGWLLVTHLALVAVAHAFAQPIGLVTNPFMEARNPVTGKVFAAGAAAIPFILLECGLRAGILGLCAAGLFRGFGKIRR